ncbi:universal stress protein [Actinosynnema sp. NPDC047251]|uniref:UspA domain protein n=1 Tax=Saccharothrix espanaensis (strain ATCC 51144 / DSM 44229 / JCM 9112 / NBRC 15066 / NRRL 15764) TaxID=1179773 RepID=K0K894_SACES|nr:universal stress protein [Saccharothrix espanaensis]CCH32898.1 UspA domain protein [Saccharothrix espanaensis DSM 44229]
MNAQPIVVGVDNTPAGLRALRWAMDEATLRGCPLHVVNVWQFEPLADWTMTSEQEARSRSEAVVENALRTAATGRRDFPQIVRDCARGSAAEVLEDRARGAALLVLAAHNGSKLRRRVLGSTSAHCVLHSTAPVVVIPAEVPSSAEPAAEEARS